MARGATFGTITMTTPVWAKDFGGREHIVVHPAKLEASQFRTTGAVLVKLSAAAAASAISIAVDALSGAIPSGTLLYFGETGELARTSANATAGATTISVNALPSALEDNDEATYEGGGKRTVSGGTFVGRTRTERDANTGFGPWVTGDEEVGLVLFDVVDLDVENDVELYRPGSAVAENYLPNWATLAADVKAGIRANYQTMVGVD